MSSCSKSTEVQMSFEKSLFEKAFFNSAYKIKVTLAVSTVFITITNGYISLFKKILETVSVVTPQPILEVWALVMPSNTYACMNAIVGTYLLKFVTNKWTKLLDYRHHAAISN